MALGIFGAPTFVVGEELFWGNERLEAVLEWCRYRKADS
jgi:2-hydroxychromene-2-carboxylate isomerase